MIPPHSQVSKGMIDTILVVMMQFVRFTLEFLYSQSLSVHSQMKANFFLVVNCQPAPLLLHDATLPEVCYHFRLSIVPLYQSDFPIKQDRCSGQLRIVEPGRE